jgi:ribonucleoside-diphosphate reductase alpha chain
MLMRVSVGIHLDDLESVLETYDLMSKKFFTHTPTLMLEHQNLKCLVSFWLCKMIVLTGYDTLKQTAKISQSAGGVGLSIHNVRATGSYIRGTNGTSNGIVPMLSIQ